MVGSRSATLTRAAPSLVFQTCLSYTFNTERSTHSRVHALTHTGQKCDLKCAEAL